MSDLDPLAPVPKLDPDRLIAGVAETTGVRLHLLGRAADGEVGAAFVRLPDGREGVLTGHGGPVETVRRTAEVLDAARRKGLPVPAYEMVVELPGAVAIVQERLPGKVPTVTDRALAEAMVGLTEQYAGLLADRLDVPTPDLYLLHSGPGFCVHESLETYSARSRRLLQWVHEVGAGEPSAMVGTDLVHLDFHPGNLLVDDTGAITGLVDWDGLARGDRRFDLVTLRYNAIPAGFGAKVEAWLDGLLDELLDPVTLRLYWAHMSLRQVDWVIRHYDSSAVEDRLDVAELRMI